MGKKRKRKSLKILNILIVLIIAIFIILQIILMSLKSIQKEENKLSDEQVQIEVKNQKIQQARESEEQVILNKLNEMEERDRIEYYFSVFIRSVENREYEKAYDMLYEDFKKNYFPDIDTFEEYVNKTFPKMMSVEHTNFERMENTYIMLVTVKSSLATGAGEGKEMKFVIRENNINDFVMSFSVI